MIARLFAFLFRRRPPPPPGLIHAERLVLGLSVTDRAMSTPWTAGRDAYLPPARRRPRPRATNPQTQRTTP